MRYLITVPAFVPSVPSAPRTARFVRVATVTLPSSQAGLSSFAGVAL